MAATPVTPNAPVKGVQAPSGGWRPWLHSIVAAAIGAVGSGITMVVVSPSTFNFTRSGLEHLAGVCGVMALIAVGALLKQSPVPPTMV